MTVFYPGPGVVITHEALTVHVPARQQFRIQELQQVHVVRGDLPSVRMVTAHIAGGALFAALVMAPALDSPLALLVTTATVVGSFGANSVCVRLSPRTYELRAVYRSLDVRLYASADAQTFGQVRRALVRALERNGR